MKRPLIPFLWPTRQATWLSWQTGIQTTQREAKGGRDDPFHDLREEIDETGRGRLLSHMREDVSALFAMQASIHKQLVNISRGVWLLVLLVFAVVASLEQVASNF